jgi:hypothetical protein
MKRNEIVESLMKEGFSEKTLVNFSDKQLATFASRILGEADIMISKKDPNATKKIEDAKKLNKSIETYEEEMKESSKKKKVSKPTIYDKALEDMGGEEGVIKFLETGKKPVNKKETKKKDKKENIKEWVSAVANKNFHSFTSKNEIMEMIQFKLSEQEVGAKVKKGHNGIPEFMSYDVISGIDTIDAEPMTKPAPVKPKTNPGTKPRTPYSPKPGEKSKPKAMGENSNKKVN